MRHDWLIGSDANHIIITLLSLEYGFITLRPIVYKTRHQAVQYVRIITRGSSGNNACLLLSLA